MKIGNSMTRSPMRQRVLRLFLLPTLAVLVASAGGTVFASGAGSEVPPTPGAGWLTRAVPDASEDHGDAPDTFGDASHTITEGVYLGSALPDAEAASQPTQYADGDDTNGIDDEEAVPNPVPTLLTTDTSYSLDVTVFNDSGTPYTLYGWLNSSGDASFGVSERVTAPVPSSGAAQTVTLTWTGFSGLSAGPTYIRLRLSNEANLGPTGAGGPGEVEDHPLAIQCGTISGPVVSASISGTQVQLGWTPISGASAYAVYRNSDPNWWPSGRPYGYATSGSWLDPDTASIGNVDINNFYLVRTSNGCGSGVDSNITGEFDFQLTPGSAA